MQTYLQKMEEFAYLLPGTIRVIAEKLAFSEEEAKRYVAFRFCRAAKEGGLVRQPDLVLLPLGEGFALAGLVLVGLGCAPIYPCIIHSTPEHFGTRNSQAMVGVQMASAYLGNCIMPPLFGLIANHISIGLFPLYLLVILAVMVCMYERTCKKAEY